MVVLDLLQEAVEVCNDGLLELWVHGGVVVGDATPRLALVKLYAMWLSWLLFVWCSPEAPLEQGRSKLLQFQTHIEP